MQVALNEGKLKFADKAKTSMKVDFDPLQIKDTKYTEPFKFLMVEAIENPDIDMEVSGSSYDEKVTLTYPTTEKELVYFLNRCKLKGSKVIPCPGCSTIFNKKATDGLEKTKP